MFMVSAGTIEDAKKLAAELINTGLERAELKFSRKHPLVVTTDSSKVGDMVSFEIGEKRFYVGFEQKSPEILSVDL